MQQEISLPLDVTRIQQMLPHRYPFLLVDRIVAFEPRVSLTGIKNVTINEPFFQGHFPGAPVMPGVLIVEAMAQVGAVYALQQLEGRDDKLVLFSGIDNARFRRPVVPGDRQAGPRAGQHRDAHRHHRHDDRVRRRNLSNLFDRQCH